MVAWRDRNAFLGDEDNWARLREACERSWPGHSHPVSEAVDLTLDSTGEVVWVDNSGALCGPPDALERIAQRASCDIPLVSPAFLDRDGTVRFPFDVALDLARAFANAEPQTVLWEVETVERKYEWEARELGNERLIQILNRLRACWALCRQWVGFDEAIAQRDREIERLRRILDDLKYDLRRSGQDELAAKLDLGSARATQEAELARRRGDNLTADQYGHGASHRDASRNLWLRRCRPTEHHLVSLATSRRHAGHR